MGGPLIPSLLTTHPSTNGIVKAVVYSGPIEITFLIILKLVIYLVHLLQHMLM